MNVIQLPVDCFMLCSSQVFQVSQYYLVKFRKEFEYFYVLNNDRFS